MADLGQVDPMRGGSVPLYLGAPTFPISLEELEQSARDRVSLLALLSVLGDRIARDRRAALVPPQIQENGFYQQLAAGDARLDLTSHYALRLAFCKTQGADWQWLVDAEAKLLALRLSLRSAQEAVAVLSRLGVEYEDAQDSEYGSADSTSESESENWTGFHRISHEPLRPPPTHYLVPFEHAARLVKERRVEMRRGSCLVSTGDMGPVAVHHFRALLQRQMRVLGRSLLMMSSDDTARLGPVLARVITWWQLEIMRQGSLGRARGNVRARIKLNEIDGASEAHFPLCMRHLHRKFRENHHLKYDGRLQYRMFLKGLGLSVHESTLFFRTEFVKVIPPARFDKEYAYHIRHSYGLEGARKDYTPFDCAQIANGPAPRHGQYHGCPFRHWDVDALRQELARCGITPQDSVEVASEAASGRHRSACRALFDATHRVPYAQAMSRSSATASLPGSDQYAQVHHPNAYVDASVAAASGPPPEGQRGQAGV